MVRDAGITPNCVFKAITGAAPAPLVAVLKHMMQERYRREENLVRRVPVRGRDRDATTSLRSAPRSMDKYDNDAIGA